MTISSIPAGRRELTRGHVTFYRAAMEGIDARKAWDLYLFAPEGAYTDFKRRKVETVVWVKLRIWRICVCEEEILVS